VLSRLVELGRARGVAPDALALALAVSLGALAAPAFAQDALGLRGGGETLADSAPPLAPPTPAAAPDAVPSVVAPPVAPDDQSNPKAKLAKTAGKPPDKKLPALKPYAGAQRAGLRGGPADSDLAPPAPSVAALPTPPKRKPPPDDKPFDPLGVKIGDLKLTPYIEEDGGWASNPGSVVGPHQGSAFETTEAGLGLQSDWSRSDLHGLLKGSYTDYFAEPADNTPTGSGTLDGRLDVTRDLAFDAEGRFNVAEQTLSSLGLTPGSNTTQHPLVSTFGATIGGAQKFGDLTVALHGTLDHTDYESITGVDLASDDFSDWGLRGRVSYRLTEAVSPFVELDADARRYDAAIDYTGYDRNSDGWQGLAGATLAFTRQLTGEASFGYGARTYADPRLPNFSAPVFDASLIWSPTALTTVTGKAQTTLGDAVIAGASGAVTRTYSLDVAHELTRAITLGATGSWTGDNYVGVDQRDSNATLGVRAEYHISRDLVLKASASRQIYVSNVPDSSYVADVFMLGLRWQR
jgi:hypothetical protein